MTKTTSTLDLGLVRLDRRKSVPLATQLYGSLRMAIQSGQLARGFRLPSTRDLALQLSVSRTTVISAFDQLVAEGYLTSVVGQGTHVCLRLPEESLMGRFHQVRTGGGAAGGEGTARKADCQMSAFGRRVSETEVRYLPAPHETKPFRAGVPALDAFPLALWSRVVRSVWRGISSDVLSYGDAEGWRPLRSAIAGYVRGFRGVRCSDEQVMIVNGTQQAIDIVCRLVLEPGDRVLFESPGYPRARQAFQAHGIQLVNVPVDPDGMNVSLAIGNGREAKLAYITPSHQFPLGVTMTIERRMQLIEWASRNPGWIVEDDYDSEFRYAHRPIPALQGLDFGDRTIYVGSFSKVIYPSLGIGFAVVPPCLVDGFRAVLAMAGRPPSLVDQMVLTEFIVEGHFARHLRRMRTVHEARRSVLLEILHQQLGGVLEIVGADAGLHLTAILDKKWNDRAIARKAAELGVLLRPLSAFFEGDQPSEFRNGLVFGFASSTPGQIRGAVRKLLTIFND